MYSGAPALREVLHYSGRHTLLTLWPQFRFSSKLSFGKHVSGGVGASALRIKPCSPAAGTARACRGEACPPTMARWGFDCARRWEGARSACRWNETRQDFDVARC